MTKKAAIPTQSLQILKPILITTKFLEVISSKLEMLFAAKLFVRPIKHKIPKRELHMMHKSHKYYKRIHL
ncbi:MAG TPA: hypothetical protein PLH25_09080 [Flavobacterium sp.]|jgi:hypothetical protein|nr:hypothetical protein [Flavobacterium sp.]HQW69809.1 hypothetical protein [Flavobacterium sp.]